MKDEQIKEMLKDNWIGKLIKIDGRKYEVINHDKSRLQVIESGKWSAQWVNKSEVSKC